MTKKLPSVIFIDLDNTILEGPFESIVFPVIMHDLSAKTGLTVGDIRRIIVRENFSRQDNPNVQPKLAMDWDDITQVVAKRFAVSPPTPTVLDIVKSHLYPPYIRLLENAVDILTIISEGNQLVAVTKGLGKYQLPIIEALGINNLFTEILTPDRHNALKNDVKFYGDWAKLATIKISVGDHLLDDVVYPKKFGFKSIWKLTDVSITPGISPFERANIINYPSTIDSKPDAIICNLNELPEVIDRMKKTPFRRIR